MKHDEEFLLWVRKVEKLLIKAEDGKWTGSEYIVGLFSLLKQSVPNYFGDIRQKRGGDEGKMIEPLAN